MCNVPNCKRKHSVWLHMTDSNNTAASNVDQNRLRSASNLQQTDSHRKSVGFIPTGEAGTQANSTAQTELDFAPKRSATDIE